MDQPVAEVVTFLDLLLAPRIGLHLPRYALFLLVGFPIHIFCEVRSRCGACSLATIFLQILVGISGSLVVFFLYTTVFEDGERVPIAGWYFPLAIAVLVILTVIFAVGIWREIRGRQALTSSLRIAIYLLTIYFAIKTIMTPVEINRALERARADEVSSRVRC